MNEKLMEKLMEKTRESLTAVLPITLIVMLLSVIFVPMDIGNMALFLVGAVLLVVGMGFFQLGAEMAMTPLGEGIGVQLSKIPKLAVVIIVSFAMGVIITIAEPDLIVLAYQVPSIPNKVLIFTVAIGVGVFLALAVIRTFFKISLAKMLLVLYLFLFLFSAFSPSDFLSIAFDSGGVTTGPITVPFIMAMGVGLASIRSDKDALDDSFGFIALCSIGPILAVFILGIFYNPSEAAYSIVNIPHITNTREIVLEFLHALPEYGHEVLMSLLPVLLVLLFFQLVTKRYRKRQFIRLLVGFLYTYIGLVLFLTGVNVGFSAIGSLLGSDLVKSAFRWLLVPIGMLIGYYIVKAEPAVQILNHQVEDVTNGAISRNAMNLCLSWGMAASVGFSMVRVLTGISIYWILIPGYAIALILTFIVPKIFIGIAFDSGGVCSGPMTTTFLLPLAIGSCEAVGGSVMTNAFGAVAMVAMTPLIAVQTMGLVYTIKQRKTEELVPDMLADVSLEEDEDIIDFEEENSDE